MSNNSPFNVPDELSLIEFFEVEPLEASPEDGYWRYEFVDHQGTKLELSFNTHAAWLETVLFRGEQTLISVVHEGAVQLSLVKELERTILQGRCEYNSAYSIVEIQAKPELRVQWSTLITK